MLLCSAADLIYNEEDNFVSGCIYVSEESAQTTNKINELYWIGRRWLDRYQFENVVYAFS